MPADEGFHGFVFRQAEPVVEVCGVAVAVFGALPELAGVGSLIQA